MFKETKSGRHLTDTSSVSLQEGTRLTREASLRKYGHNYRKQVIVLICAMSVVRIIVALTLDLGNDEAYYWLYSQHLQWNYFDHPPMIAAWTRLFTAGLLLQDEIFLRLGSIVCSALSTWFIYKCGSELHSPRAGWFAACMYSASLYAGLTAGVYVMPDAPQMLFWTLAMWMIARVSKNENNLLNWILLGIASGLCIMSKVHGVFIWFGFGLYILLMKRNWFSNPALYVSFLLTILVASPIVFWNIHHDFITYQFHTDRFAFNASSVDANNFLYEIFGQFLFNNSFNVILIGIAIIAWRKLLKKSSILAAYSFMGLPLALILLFISLFGETMIYWSGPAYISLLPLAAVWLAEKTKAGFPAVLKLSIGAGVAVMIGWMLTVNFYPGTFGSTNKNDLGKGDITLDQFGWEEAGEIFAALYDTEINAGVMPAGTPLVCTYWWGAQTEYYFSRPTGTQMLGIGTTDKIHHYLWTNKKRKDRTNAFNAYTIIPSQDAAYLPSVFLQYYEKMELASTIEIKRNGKPAHNFYVYRLKGLKKDIP